jgi:hypothetical protein
MTESRKSPKEEHERQCAEAVVASISGVSLHEMRDAPDADLVHPDGFHVGLEIVRTQDERSATLRRRLPAVSKLIQGELQAAGVCGVFSIYYDLQQMFDDGDKRAWDQTMPKRIADLFRRRGPSSADAADLVASQITCIASIECEPAAHTAVGTGWRTVTPKGETLADIVLARKNQKLATYRARNGDRFREYWLAIASLGAGTVEDGGFSMLLQRKFQTDYERVFLLMRNQAGRIVGANEVTPIRA